jgi:hypothetical protein
MKKNCEIIHVLLTLIRYLKTLVYAEILFHIIIIIIIIFIFVRKI